MTIIASDLRASRRAYLDAYLVLEVAVLLNLVEVLSALFFGSRSDRPGYAVLLKGC
jgi:hypothetical protein